MSRLDNFGEILNSYDEQFKHSWKDFLGGFEHKYCYLLNNLDDATKERIVSVYQLLKEVPDKDPMAQYFTSIKQMLSKNTESDSIRTYLDTVEAMARSFKHEQTR